MTAPDIHSLRPLVELAGNIGYSPKSRPDVYLYRNPLTYSTKRWEVWANGKNLGDFPTINQGLRAVLTDDAAKDGAS